MRDFAGPLFFSSLAHILNLCPFFRRFVTTFSTQLTPRSLYSQTQHTFLRHFKGLRDRLHINLESKTIHPAILNFAHRRQRMSMREPGQEKINKSKRNFFLGRRSEKTISSPENCTKTAFTYCPACLTAYRCAKPSAEKNPSFLYLFI